MDEHAKAISSNDSNVEEDKFDISRYQVDSFKGANMKRVPLEQLDFSIFHPNANLVAFSSTEERLPIWIKAMYLRYKHGFLNDGKIIPHWEEENNPNDPTKCDKVTITLRSQEKEKYIVSITVMVNKEESKYKTNLATLEADFIEFKQNTKKTITELSTTIFDKDIQIKNLENEITNLKTGYSKNQQLSSDLSLRQSEMEEELKKMHHKYKSLEEKNSILIGKLAALNESIESRINDDVPIESNSPASDTDIPLQTNSCPSQ
ncbi:Hypothetical predicted protein [Paramuricea clavata]|uniref:Uncharacterized protein n=1 Tax=Paramuricea clavata TaxID=317549 RepID=A0A6S7FZ46_PARCT|nr:Hypothetical predicted protein [Paramuricea clavata]